jgi:iron complex outermembrane receptor protein
MLELITDCSIGLLVVLIYTKETPKDLLLFTTKSIIFLGLVTFDNYNVGLIENKGIEIVAEVVPVRTDNLE